MKTVYKYPLEIDDVQFISMPKGAKPLCVKVQNGNPCLWALVNPYEEEESVMIRCAGTGHEINEEGELVYIDSLLMYGGDLVFHFFMVKDE